MDKTLLISFPRSGHHALISMLLAYFGKYNSERIKECPASHTGKVTEGSFVYCEHYSHCSSIYCPDEDTSLQKTHDFFLTIDVAVPFKKIVLLRENIYGCIVSYFNYQVKIGVVQDSYESWCQFFNQSLCYWVGFFYKWVKFCKDRFFITYEKFMNDPIDNLAQIIAYIDVEEINTERLQYIRNNFPIRSPCSELEFKYYDEKQKKKTSETYKNLLIK